MTSGSDQNIFMIDFCLEEIVIIRNAIKEVLNVIDDFEFQTRIGVECRRAVDFYRRLCGVLDNQIDGDNGLNFSCEEILIINNSLNEICNGVYIHDFENKIGVNRNCTRVLLDKAGFLFENLCRCSCIY